MQRQPWISHENSKTPICFTEKIHSMQCDIHAEEHSLLESIATGPGKQSDMTIYYSVNTAFMPYLDIFE